MKNQNLLSALLIIQIILLFSYTILAFKNEGSNLFSIFLLNTQNLGWSGQFNLDFSCYLTLSGLWIMWRSRFSSTSIAVGIIAMILGILFFAPYFLYLIKKENGDLKKILIGNR